jgi:hypothetical protein
MRGTGADGLVVCAGQRFDPEGSSPSAARMRGGVSKDGGNASSAGELDHGEPSTGTKSETTDTAKGMHLQSRSVREDDPEGRVSTARWNPKGVRRSTGPSSGGGHSHDEPVGQRWGEVEPALWGRRHSHPPAASGCVRTARYGRSRRDPRRTRPVPGWHRDQRPYKPHSEVGSDAGRVVGRPNST